MPLYGKLKISEKELYIYYSDSPISKNWTAHTENPVISDVSRARPAGGFYRVNGTFIRPSQNCSKRYGYGLKFNEIKVLNEREYQELEIQSVEPHWDKRIVGVHTFNYNRELNMSDAIYKARK